MQEAAVAISVFVHSERCNLLLYTDSSTAAKMLRLRSVASLMSYIRCRFPSSNFRVLVIQYSLYTADIVLVVSLCCKL